MGEVVVCVFACGKAGDERGRRVRAGGWEEWRWWYRGGRVRGWWVGGWWVGAGGEATTNAVGGGKNSVEWCWSGKAKQELERG